MRTDRVNAGRTSTKNDGSKQAAYNLEVLPHLDALN